MQKKHSKHKVNEINLLADHAKKLNAELEIKYIKSQFLQYRNLVAEDLEKFKIDKELQEKALHKVQLMINKLNEIKIKQYV
ncbi:MAG: hypothetical protein FWE03_00795 [Firmicutes bacterium]|nr:hypothetical protein [Bacillota bacterium]